MAKILLITLVNSATAVEKTQSQTPQEAMVNDYTSDRATVKKKVPSKRE